MRLTKKEKEMIQMECNIDKIVDRVVKRITGKEWDLDNSYHLKIANKVMNYAEKVLGVEFVGS